VGDVGRIERLELGEFVFNNLVASFPEKDTYVDIIAETKRQGTIGGGLTNRFTIIFDYFNQKIYLKKNSEYKRKFNYNMSGIDLISGGKDFKDFIVSELIKGSPAQKAGIKVGDKIISVNGVWKENLTLSQINHTFRSKERKKINMRILRNGEIIKKSFRLRRVI
jgi:C-terminal processing protease CtpA/Prc